MVYVGNEPTSNFASVTKDLFSGDGSTVAFTLSKASTTNGVAVFVENVRQEPTIAYAVSGTTLTFTAAPVTSSGNNIYVLHHNAVASTANHPAAQDLTAVKGTFTGDVSIDGGSFVFNESSADKDFRVESNGSANMLVVDGGNDQVNIGGAAAITNGQRFNIDGTYSSGANGANIMFFGTGTDAFPSMQILNYSHDDQSINFDSYYDGAWKSSDAGSNFSIYKRADIFAIARATGVAAGSSVTWIQAYKIDADDGRHTMTASNSGQAMLVFNDGNNANRKGIIVQCGADDAAGTNYAISFDSGNGTGQGSII